MAWNQLISFVVIIDFNPELKLNTLFCLFFVLFWFLFFFWLTFLLSVFVWPALRRFKRFWIHEHLSNKTVQYSQDFVLTPLLLQHEISYVNNLIQDHYDEGHSAADISCKVVVLCRLFHILRSDSRSPWSVLSSNQLTWGLQYLFLTKYQNASLQDKLQYCRVCFHCSAIHHGLNGLLKCCF